MVGTSNSSVIKGVSSCQEYPNVAGTIVSFHWRVPIYLMHDSNSLLHEKKSVSVSIVAVVYMVVNTKHFCPVCVFYITVLCDLFNN